MKWKAAFPSMERGLLNIPVERTDIFLMLTVPVDRTARCLP